MSSIYSIRTVLSAFLFTFLIACSNEKNQSDNQKSISETKTNFQPKEQLRLVETAKDSEYRLQDLGERSFIKRKQALESGKSVFVNPNKSFQTFLGIGGAVTDAAAEVYARLPESKQKELLDAYYSDSGIKYSLIRTTIHSSDFGTGSYTYIEDGDTSLNTFSIEKDLKYRIPLIKDIYESAAKKLTLYASPWSPPAFMKSNNDMLHGGKLLPEYYDSWAKYYTKFIEAYEKEGLPIWGITIQNEPMATQIWESCIYTAEEERDFLKNYLGPAMENAGYSDKNIVVWDHNRDLASDRANVIFDDPEASQYAWGLGFHWYEIWTGGDEHFDNLRSIKESYPEKELLFTEGCNESFDSTKYQYWPNAERYGRNMINDFNAGTVGWTDWNILLNQRGGPNHVGNYCFAPIHADLRSGELIYTPSYSYIGHFSKYIQPGAKRISTSTSHTDLLSTSWLNEDGTMATVVMNSGNEAIKYSLYVEEEACDLEISPHAIQTLIY